MKSTIQLLTILLCACIPGLAQAGPNAGGTLIVHHTPGVLTSTDATDYCDSAVLASCEAAITTVELDVVRRLWTVMAAFHPTSNPRLSGIVFGVDYDPNVVTIDYHAGCGDFQLDTGSWPGPGSGTALTWNSTRTTRLTPVYYFAGYGYANPATFSIINHPSQGLSFADDSVPSELDPVAGTGVLGFGMPGSAPCPIETDPVGACCFLTGACTVLNAVECADNAGAYQGDNSECAPNPCPQPTGACCFPVGDCTLVTEEACLAATGAFQGDGTVCDPNPCPQPDGACCFVSGACTVRTAADCATDGGAYQGDASDCVPNPCPQPTGACCFEDGPCEIQTADDCSILFGNYLGDATVCDPNSCPQPEGACCYFDASCLVQTAGDCSTAGGVYQGNFQACDPNPCPLPQPLGACCAPDGSCTATTSENCEDVWQGPLSVCDPNPCPQPTGACCYFDGVANQCVVQTAADCATIDGSTYYGNFTGCEPTPCPTPTGACCYGDGFCIEQTEDGCNSSKGGQYQGDGTVCDPNPCPQPPPTGACCFEGHFAPCQLLTEIECTDASGTFSGVGTSCNPNLCPESPAACCFDDGSCQMLTPNDCALAGGGYYNGDCDPNPCPQPTGACCVDYVCSLTTAADCAGDYYGNGTACDPTPCPPPPTTGACFFPNDGGDCSELTEANCEKNGGVYGGDGTQCGDFGSGACCIDQVCIIGPLFYCQNIGGNYLGDDSSCDPSPCLTPVGACCYIDGSCLVQTLDECEVPGDGGTEVSRGGGVYQGDGSDCDPNPCPQPIGACCVDYFCTLTTEADCFGDFYGVFSACEPTPCPVPTGACCYPDGACSVTTEVQCEGGPISGILGVYQGDGTDCDPNPCPQPPATGACCAAVGSCTVVTAADCALSGSAYQGDLTVCDPNPCPQPPTTGACCFRLGNMCRDLTPAQCTSARGTFKGLGTDCDPNPCGAPRNDAVAPGACCLEDGSCVSLSESECASQSGIFSGIGADCELQGCDAEKSTWGSIKNRYR